jgi:hypothetical protein
LRRLTLWTVAVILLLAGLSPAQAALQFHADFGRDGIYENAWPMIAGEVVVVDLYVSSVPSPGLISIGFRLVYDASKLEVQDASLDFGNWPSEQQDPSDPIGALAIVDNENGEIDIFGFRRAGLSGDHIRLGRVTFRCKETGSSQLKLLDREGDWFVLDSTDEIVLDGDIGAGVVLARIRPPVPGDVNGDEAVNLMDAIAALQRTVQLDGGTSIFTNADINGDGAIGLAEVLHALRRAAGLP